ncbi:MAG: CHAT domain-containing protein [Cyanophyceae cyanobacterium]
MFFRHLFKLALLAILGLAISLTSVIGSNSWAGQPVEQQGLELYQNAQFQEAAQFWQQAIQEYQTTGNRFGQARVLSNLSLAYQQLGQWQQAQTAVRQGLELLQSAVRDSDSLAFTRTMAQALNTLGKLQLALGQAETALNTWQQAADYYAQANNVTGVVQSQLNQAEALQRLGLYRRAFKQLLEVEPQLETQPPTVRAVGLRSLGDLLRLTGNVERSRQVLEDSLAVKGIDPNERAATLLSLGNTVRAQADVQEALDTYQQAANRATTPSLRATVRLSQFSLLLDLERWQAAAALWPQIGSEIAQLPLSHASIHARIHFAHSLTRLKAGLTTADGPSWQSITQYLTDSVQQARALDDARDLSYAQGFLGEVYAQTERWEEAQEWLEKALLLAQAARAPDVVYRWQWQLGKVLNAQGQRLQAIAAYQEAVNTLDSLRSDLAAVDLNLQFSFQESIEPIYRELVSLLLQPEADEIPQQNLAQARDVIESFRVVELDNFLRQACVTAEPVEIEQLDPQAAVIYPIILSDRLEIIVSFPDLPLRHYTSSVSAAQLEAVIEELRVGLVIRSRRLFYAPAQQLYDWLLRPMAADLANSDVNTLVFVLDGSLRNVPMATLHDGEHYLLEQYSLALSPGLRLLPPTTLEPTAIKTLMAGVSEASQGFSSLNHVVLELQEIAETATKSVVLLNEEFTEDALSNQVRFSELPIVHIATHGQFSSSLQETYILAWDSRINIRELNELLQTRTATDAIELLVLSACETAIGDKRAALGLAGVAVQAGTRSTAATLWAVNDEATALLMGQFYEELTNQQTTKAEALRQAQLKLLQNRWYRHPFYWAPYVLIGNWL